MKTSYYKYLALILIFFLFTTTINAGYVKGRFSMDSRILNKQQHYLVDDIVTYSHYINYQEFSRKRECYQFNNFINPKLISYVSNSIKINGRKISDEKDDDEGQFLNNRISININKNRNKEMIIIEYKVKILNMALGQKIDNNMELIDEDGEIEELNNIKMSVPHLVINNNANQELKVTNNEITYDIDLNNDGNEVALNMFLLEELDEGLEYVVNSLSLVKTNQQTNESVLLIDHDIKDIEYRVDDNKIIIELDNIDSYSNYHINYKAKIKNNSAKKSFINKELLSSKNDSKYQLHAINNIYLHQEDNRNDIINEIKINNDEPININNQEIIALNHNILLHDESDNSLNDDYNLINKINFNELPNLLVVKAADVTIKMFIGLSIVLLIINVIFFSVTRVIKKQLFGFNKK
jgi:uncharacterized repeat protein (TIGR01451 family)